MEKKKKHAPIDKMGTGVFGGAGKMVKDESASGQVVKQSLGEMAYDEFAEGHFEADGDMACDAMNDPDNMGVRKKEKADDSMCNIAAQAFDMLSWKAGLNDRVDNTKLIPIVSILMAIQYDKEGAYGSSWKGKGEYRGIMANIDRKYDRLDKMTTDELEGIRRSLGQIEESLANESMTNESVGESKIDAVADLANYCLLYMTYLKDKYPSVFKLWVEKNVPEELARKMSFL